MKNKYNTDEERKEARRLSVKKYNDKRKEENKNNYIINKSTINEKHKIYYKNNKNKIIQKTKEYRENNIEKEKERNKKYYNENLDKIKNESKKYRELNKDNKKEYDKKYREYRMVNDLIYLLKHKISKSIRNSLLKNNYTKKSRSHEILGCSFEELKEHLESKFETWMTWDNRGLYNGELNHGWDIDHIIPLSSAITEDDVYRLNHYTNLQPLCSYTNRYIKKDNY